MECAALQAETTTTASLIVQNIGQCDTYNLLVIRIITLKLLLDFAFRPRKNEHAKKDFSQKRSQR